MAKDSTKSLTKRSEDYSAWYLDVIEAAELAEHSVVRGCMVIKPYGYAIWENIQKILDQKFKETGHVNAYFPLFIPKSFLSKEAQHIEGFAKECAIVTHHRLKQDPQGSGLIVDPEAKLEEELIIRPTSETIIHSTYAKWIQSWRDLPILINQWANVVRWEMRTRLFLRTTEFLWQEGHTAHASEEEAEEEALKMYEVYKNFVQEYFAVPVVGGQKTESEKFAGALRTYTIEAMMQDRKALQTGTSHHLGQNFSQAFDIRFTDKDGNLQYVWQTSWGVSTRLIGALIMAHGDDKGLVLPPNIAPLHLVIVPIWKSDEEKKNVLTYAQKIASLFPSSREIKVKIDDRDYLTPGNKFHEWEKKGVPIRLEVGPKDLATEMAVLVRRDHSEKMPIPFKELLKMIPQQLEAMQKELFLRAKKNLEMNSHVVNDYGSFKEILEGKGGFLYCHFCGSESCEKSVNEETLATIRCIPFDQPQEKGLCLYCGKESHKRVVFAKAY